MSKDLSGPRYDLSCMQKKKKMMIRSKCFKMGGWYLLRTSYEVTPPGPPHSPGNSHGPHKHQNGCQ